MIYTAASLRDKIIEILGDSAGAYSTPQGRIPAVRIYDQRLPADWKLDPNPYASAEVIIPNNPEILPFKKNMHHEIILHSWRIQVVIHSLKQQWADSLHCLRQQFAAEAIGVSFTHVPPTDISSEQYLIQIEQKVLVFE
jgi:hypothetical protein